MCVCIAEVLFYIIISVGVVVAVLPYPFRGDFVAEEFYGDPTVGPRPKVWTSD